MPPSALRRSRASLIALVTIAALALFGAGAAVHFARRAPARPNHELASIDESAIQGESSKLTLVEPALMMALEKRGLDLGRVLGRGGRSTRELRANPAFAAIAGVLADDLRELGSRRGIGLDANAPNHPFRESWLDDERARFELVGVALRTDRLFAEPDSTGELRLIYRLALVPRDRPTTRLPMTLNVIAFVPTSARNELSRWSHLPERGAARAEAVAAFAMQLLPASRIELDVQNLHGPALRVTEDDHAEYILRSFDLTRDGAKPRPLLNTPKTTLSTDEQERLARFVTEHFGEIDEGRYVLPAALSATRAISVTPRGLGRARNRPFAAVFGDGLRFASLPFATGKAVRLPRALLRRLDTGTCQGCHQSRSIAGFHLLGEERPGTSPMNALEVGRSPHALEIEPFREAQFAAFVAGHDAWTSPLPFAERASEIGYGAHCGLGDPGFAAWTCGKGMKCRDGLDGGEVGSCVPADANHEGDPCQNARVIVDSVGASDGDAIVPGLSEACVFDGVTASDDHCAPNGYGFPGGVCSNECATLGEVRGDTVCADLPSAGYESTCFDTDQVIESCIKPLLVRRRLRACSRESACRDDYGCARVPGAPPGVGVCVPPYFVLQARVDGPRRDR